jgi:DNA-binding IclR family transcriptional regulator
MTHKTLNKANAIEKALQILMTFTPHNREAGTTEISQRLGFHKATVSRILLTLAKHGFLQQNPKARTYRLGPSVLSLAGAISQSLRTNVVQIAKPHIDELRDTVNETAGLEILSDGVTVLAYIAEGSRAVRTTTSLGAILPLHAAAGAKAILAHSEAKTWRALFDRGVRRLTKNTIADAAVFEEQLATIREQGFATDREEIDVGVNAVGAPVFNHEGKPVGAVVVLGPCDRIAGDPNSDLVRHLKRTAKTISAELHHSSPH